MKTRTSSDTAGDKTSSELVDLRRFRLEVLKILKDAAEGVWIRRLLDVQGTGAQRAVTIEDIRTPPAMREVQDASRAAIEAEIALERCILPGEGNVAAMRRHKELGQAYWAAYDRLARACRGFRQSEEVIMCDLVNCAEQTTLDEIERRVIDRRVLELMPELFRAVTERGQRQVSGRARAKQRRVEAERHRSEYQKLKEQNPAISKADAAQLIADECRKAKRRCRGSTVYDHLKPNRRK